MAALAQRVRRAFARPGAPVVSYTLIILCVVAYLLQLVWPGFTALMELDSVAIGGVFLSGPAAAFSGLVPFEPWRILTYGFVHSTASLIPWHLLLNMYTLWIFGVMLEPMIGRGRFLTLYLFGLVGGALGAYILAPGYAVVGASGALFAMMAALLIIQRSMGGQTTQLLVLVAINFIYGLFAGGVSWQTHLGGLVTGALVGLILAETRRSRDRRAMIGYFVLLGAVMAVLFWITPQVVWVRAFG
ncbi:MAG: Rhomboid family intramembrane serine protease [Pseudoclavibacter caeni]